MKPVRYHLFFSKSRISPSKSSCDGAVSSGSSFKSKCPFHNEKTASFYVSPDKGIYKCFGCGKTGDIFSFVSDYEGIGFSDALKKLALKAGVVLKYSSKNDEKEDSLKEKIEKINAITTFF